MYPTKKHTFSKVREELSCSESSVQKLSSELKDSEQAMLHLRAELSYSKTTVKNLNSLLKQKEQTILEVKAQLDAGEAEQVMCQCDYYKNICVAMLLGDDERQKKTIATLEQKLSQYKQPMNKFKRGTLI